MGWHPGPWDTTLKGNLEILNFEYKWDKNPVVFKLDILPQNTVL